MPVGRHSSEVSIYNKPVLTYPIGDDLDLTLVGNQVVGTFDVPLLLTAYSPVSTAPKVNSIDIIPLADERSNLGYGGATLSMGSATFPKITLQGTIDTPTLDVGGYQVPGIVANGVRMTYAELMMAYIEGRITKRIALSSAVARADDYTYPLDQYSWRKVNPLSFRDPYGRVYTKVRVLDFTASYTEAVPGRTSFSLQLKV